MILLRKQPAMCMRDTGVTGWNSYVRDTVYDPRFRENSHGMDNNENKGKPLLGVGFRSVKTAAPNLI